MVDTHNNKLRLTAAEARFGYQVAARLTEDADDLPEDVVQRLKGIRHMVVDQARARRAAAVAQTQVLSHGAAATATLGDSGESSSWRLRFGLLLAIPTLLLGLYALQHYQQERFVRKIADIDTALLLDNLPPEAYVDPGFANYLRQGG